MLDGTPAVRGVLARLEAARDVDDRQVYQYFKALSCYLNDVPVAHQVLRHCRARWEWALSYLEEHMVESQPAPPPLRSTLASGTGASRKFERTTSTRHNIDRMRSFLSAPRQDTTVASGD